MITCLLNIIILGILSVIITDYSTARTCLTNHHSNKQYFLIRAKFRMVIVWTLTPSYVSLFLCMCVNTWSLVRELQVLLQ